MNIANEIVSSVLREQTPEPFLEAGLTKEWLHAKTSGSTAVFPEDLDRAAYEYLLDHYDQHHKVPDLELFQRSYPARSYRLSGNEYTPAEIIEAANEDVRKFIVEVANDKIVDLCDQDKFKDAAECFREAASKFDKLDRASNRLTLTPVSDIKSRPIRWIWDNRFPVSHLSLAVGKPDLGKSQFAVWLAAEISRGHLPGCFKGDPRGVIYVTTEDSFEETIKPRLEAAGADISRVYRVDSREQSGKGYTLSLTAWDIDELTRLITEYDIALIAIRN